MAELVLFGALIVGAVLGLLELFFVHTDEAGMNWFTHGLHAIPFTMLFTFVSMNLDFAYAYLPGGLTSNLYVDLGVRIAIGLIAAFKIKAAAAVTQGHGSVGEKLSHALIIGALIVAAPYAWPFLQPLVESLGLF